METRVALIGIVIENKDSIEQVNKLLHEYRQYIIGRMGIPYEKRAVSIISIAMDAPTDTISALSVKSEGCQESVRKRYIPSCRTREQKRNSLMGTEGGFRRKYEGTN